MVIQIASVVFGANDGYAVVDVDDSYLSELVMQLHTQQIDSAPSAVVVSIVDALAAGGDVVFRIDGREVFRHAPDPDGGLDLVSVPVPDLRDAGGNQIMQPGQHTLRASQGVASAEATFAVLNPPPPVEELIGQDAPPVLVPGSVQPDGSRRWVFQDLAPNGLGSWVLPMNPKEMESPAFSRNLTTKTTTASAEVGGQFHIYEDATTPVEWTFSGYCPTEEMREHLEAFDALNRRWYLHDHRGRAWKVTFSALELEPHLTQIWNGDITNEGHDYKATVEVLERDWVNL